MKKLMSLLFILPDDLKARKIMEKVNREWLDSAVDLETGSINKLRKIK